MRVLQSLFEKEKKKHTLGICIPEAGKRKLMKEKLRRKRIVKDEIGSIEEVSVGSEFQVSGIFHVHDSLMLQGTALGGAINKKSVTTFKGVKLRVIDLQVGRKSPDALLEGEHGAIFLKAEKGKYPIIKSGDVLIF